MKQTIMTFSFFVSLTLTLLSGGCKDNVVQSPISYFDTSWILVKDVAEYDVRCLVSYNDELFLTANQRTDSGNFGYILNTQDGINWQVLNVFNGFISPVTFSEGILYLTTNDSLWCYSKKRGWYPFSKLPFLGSETVFDIFFLNKKLYIMANRFWEMKAQNQFREIVYPERGGKFLVDSNRAVAYFRPWAYASGFYIFNGSTFSPFMNGLSTNETNTSTVDAMFLHNNSLFAGFGNPASIKKYTNESWVRFSDSIPTRYDLNKLDPPLVTMPTVASMANDILFVGTNYSGVLKWDNSKNWVCLSNGLPHFNNNLLIYFGINYLVYFKGFLYTGFGQPTFSPYQTGLGVYRLYVQ